MLMEATNTSQKVEIREGDAARLCSSNQFAVAAGLEQISDVCNRTQQEAAKELGKDIHMLKCVNRNYRFVEVGVVARTGCKERGRALNAC